MPRIYSVIFRSADSKLAKFFIDNFNFERSGKFLTQKYEPGVGTAIEIEESEKSVKLKQNAAYWKIGFLMRDVQSHVSSLRSNGLVVRDPSQFHDIGFLCPCKDSDGNSLELLQHTFECNFKGPYPENPITLGQITISTSKPDETLDFYKKRLGMKLLSVQPVEIYDFCLYFLGYTDLDPPNCADLEAVENREWLWSQPFCTIEIYSPKKQIESYVDLKPEEKGWRGFRIRATKEEAQHLMGISESQLIRDPNNIPVYVDVEN